MGAWRSIRHRLEERRAGRRAGALRRPPVAGEPEPRATRRRTCASRTGSSARRSVRPLWARAAGGAGKRRHARSAGRAGARAASAGGAARAAACARRARRRASARTRFDRREGDPSGPSLPGSSSGRRGQCLPLLPWSSSFCLSWPFPCCSVSAAGAGAVASTGAATGAVAGAATGAGRPLCLPLPGLAFGWAAEATVAFGPLACSGCGGWTGCTGWTGCAGCAFRAFVGFLSVGVATGVGV